MKLFQMKLFRVTVIAALLAGLTGCFNFSGISGATDSYSCKAPSGITCTSVSGVYANSTAASSKKAIGTHEVANPVPPKVISRTTVRAIPASGAIRSKPRDLRVWIDSWEDSDGDVMDQSYMYMTVDPGRWLLNYNRAKPEYMPKRPVAERQAATIQETEPDDKPAGEEGENAPAH